MEDKIGWMVKDMEIEKGFWKKMKIVWFGNWFN